MLSVVDSDGTTAGGAKVTKGAGGAAAALSDRLVPCVADVRRRGDGAALSPGTG
jgi:hypothetical protein